MSDGPDLRWRSLLNLSRMGHCAPTVMQTLVDAGGGNPPWLVKLAAGLPGGIGNTGAECGGLTAPLALIGLRRGGAQHDGLPRVVHDGHALIRRFAACEGTTSCVEIRGLARVPLRCVRVVMRAPALCAQALCDDCSAALSAEQRESYRRLHAHWTDEGFHCAQAVFQDLGDLIPDTAALRDALSGFMGGTVFTGMTCSAFTAGVMALGLALGRLEDSRRRVLRMIATMAVGGDAFTDELNAFSESMNRGHRLSLWFERTFGSTRCRALTQCDFSTAAGVDRHIDDGQIARCRAIAARVATEVRAAIHAAGTAASATPADRHVSGRAMDVVIAA